MPKRNEEECAGRVETSLGVISDKRITARAKEAVCKVMWRKCRGFGVTEEDTKQRVRCSQMFSDP